MTNQRKYNRETLGSFLKGLMVQHQISASRLAAVLGISQSTMSRWLAGAVLPGIASCKSIADYAGVPVDKVLSLAGYLPEVALSPVSKWPEFREYARRKYARELDEDFITMIDSLIQIMRRKGQP
jgi:transcriptional regulator with XRE-family HTH domain